MTHETDEQRWAEKLHELCQGGASVSDLVQELHSFHAEKMKQLAGKQDPVAWKKPDSRGVISAYEKKHRLEMLALGSEGGERWLVGKDAETYSVPLYTRPQPIGEIEDWRKEAGRDVSAFAGKVKAEIEARALEEAANDIAVKHRGETTSFSKGYIFARDELADHLRQLAAEKRAAAGEGK